MSCLRESRRRRLMGYYRSCPQRHLYANGPTRTLLSKATLVFGHGRVVDGGISRCAVYHDHSASLQPVVSHVSLFVPVWQAHSPDIAKDGLVSIKAYGQLAVEWSKHLFQFRTKIDPVRYHCIDYRGWCAILARGLRITLAGRSAVRCARLNGDREQQGRFKANTIHTLEEFRLSKPVDSSLRTR